MEVEVKVKKEVTHLLAEMGVRYWEDGKINGIEDSDESPQMPLKNGDVWRLKIELATGKIEVWPEGVTASTHYKVCDDGVYTVLAAEGSAVAKVDGYVPRMMSPKDNGYGDYVIMDIGPDGLISEWKADLTCFEEEQ